MALSGCILSGSLGDSVQQTANNAVFERNTAYGNGGAIFLYNAEDHVFDSSLVTASPESASRRESPAVASRSSSVFNFVNASFVENEAANGGALCYAVNSKTHKNVTFGPSALFYGNQVSTCFSIDLLTVEIEVNNLYIITCQANSFGGALYFWVMDEVSTPWIVGGIFVNNSAGFGGGVAAWSPQAEVPSQCLACI